MVSEGAGAVSKDASFSVAAAARMIGVAPATLRTWDRRYGLGPSEHAPGSHRRYSQRDVERLREMRRLTHQGVSVGAAAVIARELEPSVAGSAIDGSDGRHEAHPVPAPGAGDPVSDRAKVRGLLRAAEALDANECVRIIDDALTADGVVVTWDGLVRPALSVVGDTWVRTGGGIEVEHLLSAAASTALVDYRQRAGRLAVGTERPPIIMASAPEELHTLPLVALSAALAERGVDSTLLGQRMPTSAMAEAVRRCGPRAVVLWAQLDVGDAREVLDELPRTRPAYTLFALGPGWGVVPPAVRQPASMGDAVEAVLADVA